MSPKPIVLIADKLAPSTVEALGDQVEIKWVDGPNRSELLAAIPEAEAILIRSATTVDAEVIEAGKKLRIIARAGVGIDNVDVSAATKQGVMVVNAPTSNIHSAAEHAIALLLATARQIPAADASLKAHEWKRSSFSGTELLGKTVGVVGLGRIGQLVAQRLAAFETHIIAFDPYVSPAKAAQLGIELVDLKTLLQRSDFITIHLPKTPETAGLIGSKELSLVKDNVIIVNAARGGLIDEEALAQAISEGKVRGAGFDVYAKEPATDNPLFDLDQVVVTPHIAASTAEAQNRAGIDVALSVKKALAGEFVADAVNISATNVEEEVAPWIDLTRKLGVIADTLARSTHPDQVYTAVNVQVSGELASSLTDILSLAGLCGVLESRSQEQVTFVNVPSIAEAQGISVELTTHAESLAYRSVVDVSLIFPQGDRVSVSGTLTGLNQVHKIVNVNGRNFDLRAQGRNLIINYEDKPGALGIVGTALGSRQIDIEAAGISQDKEGDGATMILRLDQKVPDDLVEEIKKALHASVLVQINLL